MKAKILCILFLTLTLTNSYSENAEPSESRGLLWKITGNGLVSPSYLFGTYHGKGGMQILDSIQGIDSIFNSTDQLVCETSLKDYKLFMPESKPKSKKSRELIKPWPVADSTYANILSISQKKLLDSVLMSDKMLTYIKPLNFRPLELYTTIQYSYRNQQNKSTKKVSKDNIPNDTTYVILDLFLQNRATKRNMNIVSLESKEEHQIIDDSLFKDIPQISYKSEANLLMYYIENHTLIDSSHYALLTKTLSKYLNQDIGAFVFPDEIQENEILLSNNPIFALIGNGFPKKYIELNINQRNTNWMKKIPALMAEKSCFIAVGAAHLLGELGLINQLRGLGYEVNSFQENKH